MKNIHIEADKTLKSFLKNNKLSQYRKGLVLSFLLSGGLAQASESTKNDSLDNINGLVKKLKNDIKTEKKKNKQKLNYSKLELIQLEEEGDQVVKSPWDSFQFLLSGGYTEKTKGNNTLNNGKYYAMPKTKSKNSTIDSELYKKILNNGISDSILDEILNGRIDSLDEFSDIQQALLTELLYGSGKEGHFKGYQTKDTRIVDLGISLNITGPEKNISDLDLPEATVPEVETNTQNFTVPAALNIPNIEIVSFNPTIPTISTINFNPIPILTLNGTGGSNSGVVGFFPYGEMSYNSIISQMDLISGIITVRTETDPLNISEPTNPGYYAYTLDNVIGNPSAGLIYDQRPIYDSMGVHIGNEDAVLPTGFYSNNIKNSLHGYQHVQALIKVIDNPISRIGVSGSNPENLKITLEGDVVDAQYLTQILHYDEHYAGIMDPLTSNWMMYTLDDLEDRSWITGAEKLELSNKFLDTTLGHTTTNRYFQYVENNGSWYLKGSDVVAVNLQAHGGNQEANSFFTNRGKIIGLNEVSSTQGLIGKQVGFMFTQWGLYTKQEGIDNTGLVELRAPESVGFLFGNDTFDPTYIRETINYVDPNIPDQISETYQEGKHVIMNNGDMKFYGNNNMGILTSNASKEFINYDKYVSASLTDEYLTWYNSIWASEIKLYQPLTMLGDQNVGVDIERRLDFADSKLKVDVGTEDPRQNVADVSGNFGLENSGNIVGESDLYTDGSTGIYVNMKGNIVNLIFSIVDSVDPSNDINTSGYIIYNNEVKLTDYLLNIGSYARSSAAIRVEDYGDVILSTSSDSSTNHEINLLAGGEKNAAIYLRGSNVTSIIIEPDPVWNPGHYETADVEGFVGAKLTTDGVVINIAGDKQVGAQVEEYGYFHHNNGDIKLTGTNSTGVAVKTNGLAELNNTGNIEVAATNLGIYNDETFTMNGGIITADGIASVGVYSETGNLKTTLTSGTIKSLNGGIGVYAGDMSTIKLHSGLQLVAGDKGLLFYNYNSAGTVSGKYELTGIVGATVESGGIGFYLKPNVSLTNFLNTSFIGTGKLNLNMQNDSILYLLEGAGSTVNLNDLDLIASVGGTLANNVTLDPSSGNYIPVSMNKGTLIINRNIDMDSTTDIYAKSLFSSIAVTVNNGISILSNTANKQAIAQKNFAGNSGINDILVTNNGTIDLKGTHNIGIATDYGHIVNNGTISTTGSNSIGIYSANGTLTENNGDIVIGGDSSAGIYGLNYFDGILSSSTLGYGNDSINIINSKNITSIDNSKTYGIYVNNVTVARNTSQITLSPTSSINLSSSNEGVGIYANNSTLTGGGSLTIGSNGVGVYAKDSDVNLSSFTLNMVGDNSLGFFLDGNTNFTGNGTINVSGKNIVLFNMQNSGTFNQNFTINSAVDSSYSIGNVSNGTFYYNGTSNLGESGNLIAGKNSAVLLDTPSVVTGTGNSVVVVSLDGQYTGVLPTGFTIGIDAENRGTMNLGNSSAGIYGKNGIRVLNTGTINVGNESIALHTTGVGSFIKNEGALSLGAHSVGIYGHEGTSLDNTSTGLIQSTLLSVVGIYAESITSTIVNNIGTVDLSGDGSIGIYSKETGVNTINNIGIIKIGDSSNLLTPSVGIHSASVDTINNNGVIISGKSSVGVYVKDGTMNQNGTSNIGDDGTGIYLNNSTLNISGTSNISVANNQAIGVYALNNSNIINNGNMTVQNNSYGYVLKSGSTLISTTPVSVGTHSIFVYGDASGTVQNSGDVTLTGSNGIGFYTVNGSNVNNSGDITGLNGTVNVGIYNENGSINNSGTIRLGNSVIVGLDHIPENEYSVAIYGDGASIVNTGNIELGYYGVGIYSKNAPTLVINTGNITSASDGAIGILIENSKLHNTGDIHLTGNNSIGIYANKYSEIINNSILTMDGENSVGIYLNLGSTLDNQGTININGDNSTGVMLKGGSSLINGTGGIINLQSGLVGSSMISYGGLDYPVPTIINAGIINVSENFIVKGIDIQIQVDPTTISAPTLIEDNGASFVSDAVKFNAPGFNTQKPIGVLPGFAEGTHATVYKLKDVFNPMTPTAGPDTGQVKVTSKSLTWRATPVVNERGNVDIWMEKIPYNEFTNGFWFEEFGNSLDLVYEGSTGDAGLIFDKIDLIQNELAFRRIMSNLAGDIYSNMNQREMSIEGVFNSSYYTMMNSDNLSKNNNKIAVIMNKGEVNEITEGVHDYKYQSYGVHYLKEHETVKLDDKYGYSLGYAYTKFDIEDDNDSKITSNSLQAGIHSSKYIGNKLILKNRLTGTVSLHNVERNINWSDNTTSEVTGDYISFVVSTDNTLGKELRLLPSLKLMPYVGLEASLVTRPSFKEDGVEALEVKGNTGYSVIPRVGLGLEHKVSLNNSQGLNLKTDLDVSYGYELLGVNEEESAKIRVFDTGYHKLAEAKDDKGSLKVRGAIGVDIQDRFGLSLNGEYKYEDKNQDEFRIGAAFKIIF